MLQAVMLVVLLVLILCYMVFQTVPVQDGNSKAITGKRKRKKSGAELRRRARAVATKAHDKTESGSVRSSMVLMLPFYLRHMAKAVPTAWGPQK